MKPKVGMITIGQAPRVDVVPEMADVLGPGVEIVERGALDGLAPSEIASMAPREGDEVLVTRLADGRSVFVAKSEITPRVQRKIEELESVDVAMTVLLCTGKFEGLHAEKPLVEPDKVLLGVLRGIRFRGRLGVLTPSERHVAQTEARWRSYGFDPVVVPASPYHESQSASAAAESFITNGAGLVLLDCIGFRRAAREELRAALGRGDLVERTAPGNRTAHLGVPVVVANLLVARVVAELVGA